MNNQAPAPGWYADPIEAAKLRYWDGNTWTEHTPEDEAKTPAASSFGASPSEAAYWLLPVGRSWQSLVSGYLGLFCIFAACAAGFGPIGGAFSVLVGGGTVALAVWAIRVAASGGHGRGRVIFGLVCGVLCAIVGFLGIVAGFVG